MTQVAFDELHLKKEKDAKEPLKERILKHFYCDKRRSWKMLSSYVPLVKYIRYYKPKEYLLVDIFAGISVGILHIPQGLAFGLLASVKIEDGLFTSIWPVFIYMFFGTSAHISMGTSAVICILTAGIVDKLGAEHAKTQPWGQNLTVPGGNTTISLDSIPEYMDYKESISMGVAFITGLMMIGLGIFKLGFITYYLSDSFFAAFTSAAAVHIGTSQLPAMLGISIPKFPGVFKVPLAYEAMINVITKINWAAVIIAIIVCVVIDVVKVCVNERFKTKLPAPIPIELFVVIFATIASYFGRFNEIFGLAVIGKIPNTIPMPRVPTEALAEAPKYVGDCVVLAVLIFAYTIAMAKICAKKHNYEVDDSQELLAYGMCNFLSSFLLCFPSCVAPPRTMVASTMNAKTTLSGIVPAVVMLMFTLFIGVLFEALPKSALAAIIFISLKNLFIQILDFRKYWRINKYDFAIWFFTFNATVFLDIDLGLFIGVGVSLITVVFQTQSSRGFRMGKTLKDTALVEHKRYADSREIPGLKIFRFQSSLYFANAEIFRTSLYRNTVNPRKLLKFLKKRELALEKQNKERLAEGKLPEPRRDSVLTGENLLPRGNSLPSLSSEIDRRSLGNLGLTDSNGSPTGLNQKRKISTCSVDNPAFQNDLDGSGAFKRLQDSSGTHLSHSLNSLSSSIENINMSHATRHASMDSTFTLAINEEEVDEYGEVIISDEKLKMMRKIHHIIIDCTPVNYIDASGCNVLVHIYTEYGHVGIKVFLAGFSSDMRRSLQHAGVFDKIPQENFFFELEDAVAVAKTQRVSPLTQKDLEDYSDDEATEGSFVTRM